MPAEQLRSNFAISPKGEYQPVQAEAVPRPLKVKDSDTPLQPITQREQDPAYIRVPHIQTDFASELLRY